MDYRRRRGKSEGNGSGGEAASSGGRMKVVQHGPCPAFLLFIFRILPFSLSTSQLTPLDHIPVEKREKKTAANNL